MDKTQYLYSDSLTGRRDVTNCEFEHFEALQINCLDSFALHRKKTLIERCSHIKNCLLALALLHLPELELGLRLGLVSVSAASIFALESHY